MRWFYGACEPDNEVAVRLSCSIGAVHLPELDAHDGERIVQCHVLDHGPGGVIGTLRLLLSRPRAGALGAHRVRSDSRASQHP